MNAMPRGAMSGRPFGDDGNDGAMTVPLVAETVRRLRALFERGEPDQPRGLLVLDLRIRQLAGGLLVAKARRIDDGHAGPHPASAEALVHIRPAASSGRKSGIAEDYFCFRPNRRGSTLS
jgi:hypothetical protein